MTHVEGWQTFGCQAESQEEALEIFNSGGGVFVCQELDIMNSNDVVLSEIEKEGYEEDEDNIAERQVVELQEERKRFRATLQSLCRCDDNGVNNMTMCNACRFKESFNQQNNNTL